MPAVAENRDVIERTLQQLEEYAQIMRPEDVDQPILAPSTASAVHEWLVEINNAAELSKVGVEPRRLALLYGPPGTGKTTLSHHLAARLGLPLVAVASERIVGSYLGQTGENIGRLFDLLAKVERDCVLLIDEFDALAQQRMKADQGSTQERNQALTVLLRRIEQFKGVGLAATNTKDAIDPAMWRRFGLQISVDLPADRERFAILRKYADPFDLDDAAFDVLVSATRDCSPSLLRQLMEGMKRALVLAPKLHNVDISRPAELFAHIIAAVAPPPEMNHPPLWTFPARERCLEEIAAMPWPPARIR